MKILLTGGAGYIGSHLVKALLDTKNDIRIIDNFHYNNQMAVRPFLNMVQLRRASVVDIEAYSDWIYEADVIIPTAAIVGAPACDLQPQLSVETNYQSIKKMIQLMSKNQRIIYFNTNSGYGATSGESFCTEESEMAPISLYAKTKCDAEKAVLDHSDNHISLRLATVAGPSDRMRLDLMVNDFVAKLYFNRSIKIYEPEFMRNFVNINDVCYIVRQLVIWHDWFQRPGGVYNVGNPNANISKIQLVKTIVDILKLDADQVIEVGHGEDVDKRNYVISNDKILNLFKYKVFVHSLEDTIKDLVKLYTLYDNRKDKTQQVGIPDQLMKMQNI